MTEATNERDALVKRLHEAIFEGCGKRKLNALLRDAIAALSTPPAGEQEAVAWTDEDKPLPEDADIQAHHPMENGNHKSYEEALRLVGAKRSKGALVELVNWLLQRNPADTRQQPERKVENCTTADSSYKLEGPSYARRIVRNQP